MDSEFLGFNDKSESSKGSIYNLFDCRMARVIIFMNSSGRGFKIYFVIKSTVHHFIILSDD